MKNTKHVTTISDNKIVGGKTITCSCNRFVESARNMTEALSKAAQHKKENS